MPSGSRVRIGSPKRPVYEPPRPPPPAPNPGGRPPLPRPPPRSLLLLAGLVSAPTAAADSTPPPARKVTVQGAKLTAADVAKAIREHASIDVNVSALDDDKTFDLNLQKADFWAAVHQLAEKTGSK